MDQQLNSSADLFSTRSDGENQTFLKPVSSLAATAPLTAEAQEAEWARIYTPNEPDEAGEASPIRSRRSRLVERRTAGEPEAIENAPAAQERPNAPFQAPPFPWQPSPETKEQPAAEQPAVAQPAPEPTFEEQPAAEQPAAAQSAPEPAFEERPVIEQSAAARFAQEPAYEEPFFTEQPTAQPAPEPTLEEQPVIEQPAAVQPAQEPTEAPSASRFAGAVSGEPADPGPTVNAQPGQGIPYFSPYAPPPYPGPNPSQGSPDNPAPPVYWAPVAPPQGSGQTPGGWPPNGASPVFIPVYFAPYPQPNGASDVMATYAFPYGPSTAPARDASGQGEPSAENAPPQGGRRWEEPAPYQPSHEAEEPQEDAAAHREYEETEWTSNGEPDAIPSESMAAPIPVPLSKLDFSTPKKQPVWPWVALIVLLILVAAAVALWKTGLYQKLPIPSLTALFPAQSVTQPAVEASPAPALAETDAPEATAAPADDGKAMVTEFSVDATRAIAPAEIIFSATTNAHAKQIRLMNAVGIPLSAQIGSVAEGDELKWNCQVSFPSGYQGDVTLFVCGEDGFWFDSGYKVTLEIE